MVVISGPEMIADGEKISAAHFFIKKNPVRLDEKRGSSNGV